MLLPAVLLAVLGVGSHLGVIEATYQPMKIAAAEAQWDDVPAVLVLGASRSAAATDDETPTKIIEIPHLLSILATGTWDGEVAGPRTSSTPSTSSSTARATTCPNVFIQYWSMRVMAYLGSLGALLALWGGWLLWRRKTASVPGVPLASRPGRSLAPFLMNTAGWLLTENGRQPWIVQGLMQTKDGVSPSVEHDRGRRSAWSSSTASTSLLGAVAVFLMLRYARRGLELEHDERRRRTPTTPVPASRR